MLVTPAVHRAVNLLRRIAAETAVESARLGASDMSAATALIAEKLVTVTDSRWTRDGWSNRLVVTAEGARVAASF